MPRIDPNSFNNAPQPGGAAYDRDIARANNDASKYNGSKALKAKDNIKNDFNQFLTMFITYLKQQDPTSPMEADQMMQQLATFTQVEQTINTNANLESLIKMQEVNRLSQAVNYIDNIVEIDGSKAKMDKSIVPVFQYSINGEASKVNIQVFDQHGSMVSEDLVYNKKAGAHQYMWEGIDAFGRKLPDGEYSIKIAALNKEGVQIQSTTSVLGKVDGALVRDNKTVLIVNGEEISVEKVIGITHPKQRIDEI